MSQVTSPAGPPPDAPPSGFVDRCLGWIERVGNKLPDPALLFVFALFATWVLSWLLAGHGFEVPSKAGLQARAVENQLSGAALTQFLMDMVKTFTGFHPLGVVLVALLGVGVAEASGFVNAVLKRLLGFTPKMLLTPMLIAVAILSHTAADAGYVLVVPLGGAIFYAAGRHPLAGIVAAFAGVSGGFSANPVPSGIDPLLQGITQEAAAILDPTRQVNPLCNWTFMAASSVLIVLIGWFLVDKVIEPRLRRTPVDGDPADMPTLGALTDSERRGLRAGLIALFLGVAALVGVTLPMDSAMRAPDGSLTAFSAPIMQSIVPLIFILFLIPGLAHGYASGTFKSHRDVIQGMAKALSTMGYYLVMAFFASLFIYSFNKSQLGALVAVEGATFIRALGLPAAVTLIFMIVLTGGVNLLIGSASAKWALLAPILVPMFMQLGFSPELTQAAYRVGDSTTNIVTPLMPYFPLVVAYCQRYVKGTGIGTLTSLMLPFTVTFMVFWTAFLILFWALGIPLGIQGVYTYP